MRRRSLPFLATPAALAALLLAGSARGAVFQVTTTADLERGACAAGDCSLREAVVAANVAAGADVVVLPEGSYDLQIAGADEDDGESGDLDVEGELTILGDGSVGTVVRGTSDRVFHVLSGAELELRDLTVYGGLVTGNGGGVLNQGTTTLTRVSVQSNRANAGLDSGFGGGIFNALEATLAVADSTFAGNVAADSGGALAVHGTATVVNSTFALNNALAASGGGGGIYFFGDARLTLNNVTVARNHANGRGGGIVAESNAFLGFPPAVSNSVVALNTAGQHPDCSGTLDSRYSLVGNATGCNGPSAASGDRFGTAAAPLDPLLGTLGENGGPTPTLLPAPASPAVNVADPAAPGTAGACAPRDQRGAVRPGGPRCDMGAVELVSACVNGGDTLCLQGGRFQVRAEFQRTQSGPLQRAGAVRLTDDSGYFWFFDDDNVEVTVKVLDACAANNRFWVFHAGMTNVRVVLTVTDTATGRVKTYTNPLGRTYAAVLDTRALPCN